MKFFKMVLFGSLIVVSCGLGEKSSRDNSPTWRESDYNGVKIMVNEGDINLIEAPNAPSYPVLIGGAPADRKDWPASFTTSQGNSRCTGTMIGPQVLQLAAHCVGNGKTASITKDGVVYKSTCSHSPDYKTDPTADYALCKMEKEVDLPLYESIHQSDKSVKVGDKILLAGMGCVNQGGGGGNDDVFRVGETSVVGIPTRDNDIVTKGNVALCFGDSGGSAFWKDEKGIYKVIGINSRGDIQTTSYLSAVFTKPAKDFYLDFSVKNNVKICGYSDSVAKCRGDGGVDPNPTPVPPWCAATLEKVNRCIYGNPRLSLTDPEGCRKSYAELFACQQASERQE